MSTQDTIPSGFSLRHTLIGHEAHINMIAWSPDGQLLASSSDDCTIRIWSTKTGRLVQKLEGNRLPIKSVAWMPDSRTIASGSLDYNVCLQDIWTGQVLRTFRLIDTELEELLKSIPIEHTNLFEHLKSSPMKYSDLSEHLKSSPMKYSNLFERLQSSQMKSSVPRSFALYLQNIRNIHDDDELQNIRNIHDDNYLHNSIRFSTIKSSNYFVIFPKNNELEKITQTILMLNTFGRTQSSDLQFIVLETEDQTIQVKPAMTSELSPILSRFSNLPVAWLPDKHLLAIYATNNSINLSSFGTKPQTVTLEGHTDRVTSLSFSYDGQFLASKSWDGTVRLWKSDPWETVAILNEPSGKELHAGLDFHPNAQVLATVGEEGKVIHIWELNLPILLRQSSTIPSAHYSNAKVILVGDTSVGKTGLSLVLTGQPFVPTESTHGRHVWIFDRQEVEIESNHKETREIVLWDLAGQPGYRLIHQLHLNEVVVALVVFDARSETDPFAGVHHWERALRVVGCIQGNPLLPMKKFLVAARTDRAGIDVSRTRIEALTKELGFDGFFETSAKTGRNIPELAEAIRRAINWDALPKVSSTDLFQQIKTFIVEEKKAGQLLSTIDNMYHAFLRTNEAPVDSNDLRAQFETCIGLVESRDLIRHLNFGNLVLLQPELLDAYASALINAVKDEPDGLGSILEAKVRMGDFSMSEDERLKDKEQEKLLLIAMVEDLLRYEIALREPSDEGSYLIFPSRSTRENPNLPEPEGKAVVFRFEGPILSIYTRLAVRLSHSGLFKKKDLWKNAITYTTSVGGTYGIFLQNMGEGLGELTLFFDESASEEARFHFEEYIQTHLQRQALPNSIQRRRTFVCSDSECGFVVSEQLVRIRKKRDFNWVDCPGCGNRILLLDREERFAVVPSSRILEMDNIADSQRDIEAAKSTISGEEGNSGLRCISLSSQYRQTCSEEDRRATQKTGDFALA